jgi:transcriptional regulator with XRE-family HTH domain
MGAMEKSIYTPEYRALCLELRRIRESAGLTQRALSARLKVPHSWVAKVESGERRIDLVEFCWFVEACGTDPLGAFQHIAGKPLTLQPRGHPKRGRAK